MWRSNDDIRTSSGNYNARVRVRRAEQARQMSEAPRLELRRRSKMYCTGSNRKNIIFRFVRYLKKSMQMTCAASMREQKLKIFLFFLIIFFRGLFLKNLFCSGLVKKPWDLALYYSTVYRDGRRRTGFLLFVTGMRRERLSLSIPPVPPLPEHTERSNVQRRKARLDSHRSAFKRIWEMNFILVHQKIFTKVMLGFQNVYNFQDTNCTWHKRCGYGSNTSMLTIQVSPTCLFENCLSPSPVRW